MHPKENISEDIENKVESEEEIIKDKEQKEDHCSKASNDVSSRSEPYLNPDKYKRWLKVGLLVPAQRDQQIAFLLDALKFDKSEVHSIYQFFDIFGFHAFLTKEEADKFSELEQVDFVGPPSPRWRRQQQTKSRRKTYTVTKIKKRKLSIGSILSEQRKNREKWRYNEDLELGTKIEELEEESEDYCSSDSSDSYDGSEFYLPFDESGKRHSPASPISSHVSYMQLHKNSSSILEFFEEQVRAETLQAAVSVDPCMPRHAIVCRGIQLAGGRCRGIRKVMETHQGFERNKK